jgi:hypothetical protein
MLSGRFYWISAEESAFDAAAQRRSLATTSSHYLVAEAMTSPTFSLFACRVTHRRIVSMPQITELIRRYVAFWN